MIKIFAKTSSSLSKKRQYFCQIFRRKYFKNHNIGPWQQAGAVRLYEFSPMGNCVTAGGVAQWTSHPPQQQ
jgi:hypothetical protein